MLLWICIQDERILYILLFRHVPLFRFWELLSRICTHFLQVIVCLLSLARGRGREQRRGRRGRVREGGGKKWKRKGKIRGEYMWLAFSIDTCNMTSFTPDLFNCQHCQHTQKPHISVTANLPLSSLWQTPVSHCSSSEQLQNTAGTEDEEWRPYN